MTGNDFLTLVICIFGCYVIHRLSSNVGWNEGYQSGWNDALNKVAEIQSLDEMSRIFERMNRR